MRSNRTSARRPAPVSAPRTVPAMGSVAPALISSLARSIAPALPTWRAALDALWASLANDSAAHVDVGPTPPGSAGPRRLHPERDAAEQSRIAALVELAQGGDKEAFAQLYDSYVDTVFRYVLVRVANRSLAEDLTSETFLRAMRRIDSFSWQGKDIAAWFVTIARNLIADHVKSAKFRFEVATADMRDADERV
ncbi:MAG: sigma-70 family RNA polymerase sigma factor, partial [Dermatophilaceae bacterium]|nr:sigma-70 family RNA polymerase sigma factor [Dermatophilaceae bacterium]